MNSKDLSFYTNVSNPPKVSEHICHVSLWWFLCLDWLWLWVVNGIIRTNGSDVININSPNAIYTSYETGSDHHEAGTGWPMIWKLLGRQRLTNERPMGKLWHSSDDCVLGGSHEICNLGNWPNIDWWRHPRTKFILGPLLIIIIITWQKTRTVLQDIIYGKLPESLWKR